MNDARNYSNYEVGAALDNKLKKEANIKTNTTYRKYLQNNADSIIKNNQLSACDECSTCPYYSVSAQNKPTTKPYIFDSIISNKQPYGYETSDLKNIYLSRQVLEAQMHAPRFRIPNEEK